MTPAQDNALARDQHQRRYPFPMLDEISWRVWILGFGAGGCAGIASAAGIWSCCVDASPQTGVAILAIGLVHAIAIVGFWHQRSSVSIRLAAYTCAVIGASGLALIATILLQTDSQVPGGTSLYSLAVMAIGMGFALPYSAAYSGSNQKPAAAKHE